MPGQPSTFMRSRETPILEQSSLTGEQKVAVHRLWNNEYPVKLDCKTIADLDAYLATLPSVAHYLLNNSAGQIDGWAMTFVVEGETWFTITIDGAVQARGKGSLLLKRLQATSAALHGWVIDCDDELKQNGERYSSPLAFYQKNGFVVDADSRLEARLLSAVEVVWRRTNAPVASPEA